MTVCEAYGNAAKLGMSGREAEASALTKAALLLRQCRDDWQARDHEGKLAEALAFNQRLWSIFQAELANPGHPLPPRLRRDILELSLFIDRRIFDIMAYPAPEKLTAIVNINLNLAAGLRSATAGPPEQNPPAEPAVETQLSALWA